MRKGKKWKKVKKKKRKKREVGGEKKEIHTNNPLHHTGSSKFTWCSS